MPDAIVAHRVLVVLMPVSIRQNVHSACRRDRLRSHVESLTDDLPNFMIAAVSDIDRAVRVHKYAMWTIQLASPEISVRTIAGLPVANQRIDFAGGPIDDADDMILRVADQNISLFVDGDTLRAAKQGESCVSTITRVALFTCSRDVMQRLCFRVDSIN